MKTVYLLLIVIIFSTQVYSEQYYWQQSYPYNYSLHDISSYDSTECYVLGRRLSSIVIIKSTDLGTNWKVIKDDYGTEINVPLVSFRISNPFKNYIYLGLENYTIMKSSDGGVSFDTLKVIPHIEEEDDYLRGLHMLDTNPLDGNNLNLQNFQKLNNPHYNISQSDNTLTVSAKETNSSNINITIYNLQGILMSEQNCEFSNNQITCNFDISKYPLGTYFYYIITDGVLKETGKFIILK